ncbi:hypothetical protein E2C01_019195 [Portunus trituberculatus]|uniref:Uncharacterized protein n=1 Tax=Portunus trituberculatus TaxID=210409 RepID=A0A5B7DXL6_PORTR|nr:hypothetical protein [Portunus trituberculatus]
MGHVVAGPVRAYIDFGTRDDASHPRRTVIVPPCAEMVLPRVLVLLLVCCCLATAGKIHFESKVMLPSHAREVHIQPSVCCYRYYQLFS